MPAHKIYATQEEQLAAAQRRRNDAFLQKRYGISADQFDAILAAQGGHCVFCSRRKETNGNRLSVDHDKKTGRIRGILCLLHNGALGAFGDTREGLQRALVYLEVPDA